MKKEKKSPRSKILERRRHKACRSKHRKQSELGERHQKRHRSRSPSSSKRKSSENHKEHETPKPIPEVSNTAVKTEFHHPDEAEQDCTSLANFIDDKQQMIQELFETICEEKVKKMTPESLKNCPLEELKIMCLEELNRMTNVEIIYILSGKDPALFEPPGNSNEGKKDEMLIPMVEGIEEHSEPNLKEKCGQTPHSPTADQSKELASSKRQSAADDQESTSSITGDTKSEAESDSLELCATQKEIDSLIQEEIMNQTGAQGLAQQSKTDLTDMEILELELRARIIRSLLRSHGMNIADEEDGVQQKENVGIQEENT